MHSIHTTSGFIINSRPHGEAGKLLSIFTRDFGLVLANAQGIRLEKSKLRPFIQDYSFGIFSLVKGKELWRLVSAQELPNLQVLEGTLSSPAGAASHSQSPPLLPKASPRPEDSEVLALVARLALLLRRLLQGEEPHSQLFDVIMSCKEFLQNNALSEEQQKTLESLIVLRMMHALGYIGKDVGLEEHIISNTVSIELVDQLAGKRTIMNQHINKALKESHL